MKKSNIPWLPEIPKHWETRRLNLCLVGQLRNGIFKKSEEFGFGTKLVNVSDLYADSFYVDFEKLDRVNADAMENETFKVRQGDFFFVRSSLKIEGIARAASISEVPEPTVFECHIVKGSPNPGVLNPDYLIYYLNGIHARKRLISLANTVTMTTIPQNALKSLEVFLPPLDEQRAIAAFLDHKTAQIDTLIDKKRRMIELLKEKRTALISHAVTKGLNPDAPMKDSGVPWLGQVPGHWEVKRLKFVVSMFGGGTPDTNNPLYWDGGISWVSPKDMKEAEITGTEDTISAAGLFHSSSKLAPTGCVLIVTRSGILRHTIPVGINRVKVALNQDIKALNTKERLRPEYLMYFIQGKNRELLSIWRKEGTTVESLEHDYYANSPTPIPPVVEQDQIVKSIQGELSGLEKMSSAAEEALTKLQEYRVAIISAAVTGQIDVRNWVAHA